MSRVCRLASPQGDQTVRSDRLQRRHRGAASEETGLRAARAFLLRAGDHGGRRRGLCAARNEKAGCDLSLGHHHAQGSRQAGLRCLRSQVGMIFQDHNLVPRLSVLKNALAGRLSRMPSGCRCCKYSATRTCASRSTACGASSWKTAPVEPRRPAFRRAAAARGDCAHPRALATRDRPPCFHLVSGERSERMSGVPDTSAKARIIPATPSTAALGAFFDSVAALKSDRVFDPVVISPPSDAIAETVRNA